jgi:hypothetical protein
MSGAVRWLPRGWCLELRESRAHLGDHGEVLLALVALERLLEGDGGLLAAPGGCEHLGEVAERIALHVEPIRALGDRDRLPGERFRLGVLAAAIGGEL